MTFRFVQYQTEFRVPEPPSIRPVLSMGGDVCFHNIFVISQAVTPPLTPTAAAAFKEGWRGFETDAFKVPLAAAQQKWETFEPAGTIVSIFPEGWRGIQLDASRIPPLNPAQQQWTPWTAQPPYNTVLTAWAETTPRFAKPLAASEHPFDSWPSLPPYNTVLTAWEELTPRFALPFPVTQQRWDAWPFGLFNTALTAWVEQDYKFAKPLPVTEQRWEGFQPQGTIVSIFPEGWRGFETDAFKAPFAAAQQRWESFQPQGTIAAVTYPDGWRGLQLDARLAKPFPIAEQKFDAYEPQGAVISVPFEGWRGFETDAFKPSLAAAQQRWDSFEPFPAAAFPEGWRGLDDVIASHYFVINQQTAPVPFTPPTFNDYYSFELDYAFKAPFSAAQQKWESFEPQGAITTVVFPEGWRGLDDVVFSDLCVIYQQTSLVPFTPPTFNDYYSFELDYAFKAPVPAARQQWDSWPAEKIATSVTFPEGWRGLDDGVFSDYYVIYQQTSLVPFTPPVFNDFYSFELDAAFKAPVPAAQQKWDSWPALTTAITTVFEGWRGFEVDLFAKPFPAAEQKWDSWPAIPPYNTVLTAWQETTPRFVPPFKAAEQRWDYWPPIPPYNTVLTAWVEQDYKFAVPFPAALQQNIQALEPRGTITSVFPEGWRGFEVDRFVAPFPVALQKWDAWPAQKITITATPFPEGWRGFETDVFAKPFPVAYQKWDAHLPLPAAIIPVPVMSGDVAFHSIFVISQVIVQPWNKVFSILPEGWRGFETDAFTKHYPPASEQQWSSFTPQGKIVSLLPDGWRGYEVDVFTKHYPPAHEQQWSAWLPEFVKFIAPDGWRGYEVDRFTKPFPVIEQKFDAWPPQVIIFPAALVPGGGKRVLPKQFPQPPWDVEERKTPVWPIWDRVKWEEERRRNAQVPGTRAPVAPPPQEIFRGPPRIVTPAGLPSFREYTPPDAAGLARQMADARELGDAIAAVRALQVAQTQQQNTDEDDMADALRALAALGIKGGGG